jgi:CubicO group peptidase (beta-lactamase class C family)
LPKFFADAPESWRGITILHLLTHTSGIPDVEDGKLDLRRDYSEEELAALFQTFALEFAPGTRWNYSNTGYILLGIVVRKVSGRFYGDLLAERVFKPLGMHATRIISEADIVPNRAAGYQLERGELRNQDWVAPALNTTADGSLYLTLQDLITWDAALRAGKVLSAASWRAVYEPVQLASGKPYPYGFGWAVEKRNGRLLHHHSGSWQGFKTYIARYIDDDFTVIVLANVAQARPIQIGDGIAALIEPKVAQAPLAAIRDRDPRVTARALSLLGAAAAGQLKPEDFAFVPTGFFPGTAQAIQKQLSGLGAVQSLVLLARESLGDDTVYVYDAHYATGVLRYALALAPDGKLADYSVETER